MKKRRILAAVLLVSLLTCVCTAEKVSENETAANQVSEADTVVTEAEEIAPTFDGAEWTVLQYDATFKRYYFAPEEFADVLSSAAYERNMETEQKHDVVIKQAAGTNNTVYSDLKKAITAGDAVYDAVVPHFVDPYASMVVEGLISDLNSFDELKLDKAWWYPEVKNLLTVGGHLYFTGNYYTITCTNLFTLLYNKELMSALNIASPTKAALNGEWYFDDMVEMMAQATSDIDGNGVMDGNDRYGLINASNIMYPIMGAFCQPSISIDNDGRPVLCLNNERTSHIVDKINQMLESGDIYFGSYNNNEYVTKNFAQGQGLFAYFGLGTYYQLLRDMEIEYGILPFPKLDENQKEYGALRSDSYVGMPSLLGDSVKSSAVFETLAKLSMELVYPAFKENVLYAKCLRDEESADIMDIIWKSFTYDFAFPYSTNRSLAMMLSDKQINFASFYEKNAGRVQQELDKFYDSIMENEK